MPTTKKDLGSVTLSDGSVVKVAKPTLLQIRAVNKIEDETEQEVIMVSNITGKNEDELNAMPYDDYVLLANKANTFLYHVGKTREGALA